MTLPPLQERTLARLLRARATALDEKTFLLFQGQRYSYAQAYALSCRVANGLLAAGVRPGQHVAIMMENRPETLWANFALAFVGAVAVPINTASRGDLLAYYIRQSDSTSLILDEAFIERVSRVEAQCPQLERAVVLRDADPAGRGAQRLAQAATIEWEEVMGAPDSAPDTEPAYSDALQILYSSGTTGPAKGSLISNATAVRTAAKHVEVFGYRGDDIMHTCLPMFHGNAMNCTVLPALYAGASVALFPRFSTRRFWSEINESGATRTSLLSAMINFLWQKPPSEEERGHRLRTCHVVPMPEFAPEFEKRFNVTLTSLYGLGDFGYATMFGPEAPRDKLGSAGKVLPEVELALLDEHDVPVPVGQVGQICLRTHEPWFARQGYYNMPEAWARLLRNYWFHSGDLGWLDQDGYLYFAGRDKDVIRRRGENISAIQVEDVIRRHPAVADVAVYAVRSELMEDEVMASIVCKEGGTLDITGLITFCAPQMAYFMVPRYVEVLAELPLTATGKVEKYKLRDNAQPRLDEIWDREKHNIVLEK